MVSSADGMIARKDNTVSWFNTTDTYANGVPEPDTEAFLKTIDCYVMGARTYEHALELSQTYGWAYGDTPTIVVTHRELPVHKKNVELYSGNLSQLINNHLKPQYPNIWIAGGASLARDFLQLQLADELRLSILPIMLGDGIPFPGRLVQEQPLHLKEVTAYQNGMVELWYEIKKNDQSNSL